MKTFLPSTEEDIQERAHLILCESRLFVRFKYCQNNLVLWFPVVVQNYSSQHTLSATSCQGMLRAVHEL